MRNRISGTMFSLKIRRTYFLNLFIIFVPQILAALHHHRNIFRWWLAKVRDNVARLPFQEVYIHMISLAIVFCHIKTKAANWKTFHKESGTSLAALQYKAV